LIVEPYQVINDLLVSVWEDLHSSYGSIDGGAKDVGVFRPQVVENVFVLVLFVKVKGPVSDNKTILVPEFLGYHLHVLIKLEDPKLR